MRARAAAAAGFPKKRRRLATQWPPPLDLALPLKLRHAGVDAGAAEANQSFHAVLRSRLGEGAQRGAIQGAPRQRRPGRAATGDGLVVNAQQRVRGARPRKASGGGLKVFRVISLKVLGERSASRPLAASHPQPSKAQNARGQTAPSFSSTSSAPGGSVGWNRSFSANSVTASCRGGKGWEDHAENFQSAAACFPGPRPPDALLSVYNEAVDAAFLDGVGGGGAEGSRGVACLALAANLCRVEKHAGRSRKARAFGRLWLT